MNTAIKKTGYQKWLSGELSNLGSFATSLMQTYMKADSTNQAKLEQAFPEWFTIRQKLDQSKYNTYIHGIKNK